jgi:hypothetical protein
MEVEGQRLLDDFSKSTSSKQVNPEPFVLSRCDIWAEPSLIQEYLQQFRLLHLEDKPAREKHSCVSLGP